MAFRPAVDLRRVRWNKVRDRKVLKGNAFIVLPVERDGLTTRKLIESFGLEYHSIAGGSGNTYYEWIRTESLLKQNVDLVVYDVKGNRFITGNGVREVLQLPPRGGEYRKPDQREDIAYFSPVAVDGRDEFPVFISSTSATRKLVRGTRVLYKVIHPMQLPLFGCRLAPFYNYSKERACKHTKRKV